MTGRPHNLQPSHLGLSQKTVGVIRLYATAGNVRDQGPTSMYVDGSEQLGSNMSG